ncbi:hypothetical protein, partial [Psychrobacter sp. TB47]|uniref:hypothetical protein n=1 Tax=Psychrobacter sp. TB47 TaxID=985259 RepID=UPI001F11E98E
MEPAIVFMVNRLCRNGFAELTFKQAVAGEMRATVVGHPFIFLVYSDKGAASYPVIMVRQFYPV